MLDHSQYMERRSSSAHPRALTRPADSRRKVRYATMILGTMIACACADGSARVDQADGEGSGGRSVAVVRAAVNNQRGRTYFGLAGGRPLAGDLLLGHYANGFVRSGYDTSAFRVGQAVNAVSDSGEVLVLAIDRVSLGPLELGESHLALRLEEGETRRAPSGTVLFWTSGLGVTYLRPLATELDSAALAMLFDRATTLYEAALAERDTTLAIPMFVSFEGPEIRTVEPAREMVAVQFGVTFERGSRGRIDKRGVVFFIYNRETRRVAFEAFGHGEWGPMATSPVLVDPYIYFQIEGDASVYFLSKHSRAWEHYGLAIFDFRTGRPMILSY